MVRLLLGLWLVATTPVLDAAASLDDSTVTGRRLGSPAAALRAAAALPASPAGRPLPWLPPSKLNGESSSSSNAVPLKTSSDSSAGLDAPLVAPGVGYSSATSPFYGDPLFDGAHDAELVWHEGEQCWWLTYLQNRYNSCTMQKGNGPTGSTTGTDLGLSSTPDGGKTWVYRGVMGGLDVPSSDRQEPLPPGSTTAQYGGATWWRPAVTTVNGVYHGFFSQWEQSKDWGKWKVIHYSSTDMKNWKFEQYVRNSTCPQNAPVTANCTTAYDSAVFRVGRRYVLFSAGPSPGFAGPHPPLLCTSDPNLQQWAQCSDSLRLYKHLASLKQSPGAEGMHVIDRNASVTYEGYSWMNWEGRGPNCEHTNHTCKPGTPNLARSSDGGLSWQASITNLWGADYGTRLFDAGQIAFQGPLLLQGDALYALYFTEFSTDGIKFPNALPGCSASPTCSGISDHRSMLQVARVRLNQTSGWLQGNRSEPFTLALQPPPNAAPPPSKVLPTVWAVAKVEAAVIALAEIDRWLEIPQATSEGKLQYGILSGYKLREAGYQITAQPTPQACVAACTTDVNCSAITYCASRNMTYCKCTAGKGKDGGCCFMMSKAADGGACRAGAKSNCGAPTSAACAGWSSSSELGLRVPPAGAGDYAGDEYQRWRNPQYSESYFDSINKTGNGRTTQWRLSHVHADTCGRCSGRTEFEIVVAANGTITELMFNGGPLVPLQWRR